MSARLVAAGHELIGLDPRLYHGCDLGTYVSPVPTIQRDLRDIAAEDLDGFDAVVHLAAITSDTASAVEPQHTLEINHAASIRLAQLAREAGVRRFLFASTCSAYATTDPDEPLDETTPFRPTTSYGESKVKVEADLSAMAADQFSPIFLRCASVYGVSPRFRGDLLVNNMVGHAFTTGEIPLENDGSCRHPFVHVEDVCLAFACALVAPREHIHNEAFHVGRDDQNLHFSEVAEIVQARLPESSIVGTESVDPNPRRYRVDFGKIARTFPDFKPAWTIERGVDQLLQAFTILGLDKSDLEGARFQRRKQILSLLEEGKVCSELRWKP